LLRLAVGGLEKAQFLLDKTRKRTLTRAHWIRARGLPNRLRQPRIKRRPSLTVHGCSRSRGEPLPPSVPSSSSGARGSTKICCLYFQKNVLTNAKTCPRR
jgi:hypothetical protein